MPPVENPFFLTENTQSFPSAEDTRELRARTARRDIAERRRVTLRLRQALAEDGFLLQYQPQIHLKSGTIRGAEAVIRLQHRRRGLIMPHHFMPVAERSDVINDIGGWVLRHACAAASRWPSRYTLAVSLSHRQLRSGRLIKPLIEALHHSALAPDRLELELSEAMLIDDNEDTIFNLRAIRGIGVNMALNNFGAGYASLSALKRLPLTTLKLDRSMIATLGRDDDEAAMTRAAIEAGHVLGCSVLADGVETEAQVQKLLEIGCDEARGPFFSQPLSAVELAAKLNLA